MNPLLSMRTLVLAKLETTYNTDAAPAASTDAFLVSNCDVKVDASVLERNNYRPSLSPSAVGVGRKLVTVTFSHEVKASGTVGVASKLGTLLRACGFSQTAVVAGAATQIASPVAASGNTSPAVTYVKAGAPTKQGTYGLKVTKGGASTVAEVQVYGSPFWRGDTTVIASPTYSASEVSASGTVAVDASDLAAPTITVGGSWTVGDVINAVVGGIDFQYTVNTNDGTTNNNVAAGLAALIATDARFATTAALAAVVTVEFSVAAGPVVVTSGTTALALGNSGSTLTPTWTGSLVVGDVWTVGLSHAGLHYMPVSSDFESITIYVYFDGLLHKVTGCMGTVSFSGEAGKFATANFTFTGQYIAVSDVALPNNAVYESTAPTQVELAGLTVDDVSTLVASSFSFDVANTIVPRDDVNSPDGYNGVRLTGRAPKGGFNPEATLEANFPAWSRLSSGAVCKFHAGVGQSAGNIVDFIAEGTQFSGVGYSDRNGTRAYDIGLRFSAVSSTGDDELHLIFR